MSWQVAILKILASRSDGEAPVAAIARDLSLLVSGNDGWSTRQRTKLPPNRPRDLFSDGLVTRPSKGSWRISDAGKAYLRLIEQPLADDDLETDDI